MAGQQPHAAGLRLTTDLGDHPGLSHTGLARDNRESAVAGQRLVDRPAQVSLLAISTYQRCQPGCQNARTLHG